VSDSFKTSDIPKKSPDGFATGPSSAITSRLAMAASLLPSNIILARTQKRIWPRWTAPSPIPGNGVIISADGGKTSSEHGSIRLTPNDRYFGWAENNLVELSDGRLVMIIRADGLGGLLFKAESTDGGKTWPDYASITAIPNPGSEATLYSFRRRHRGPASTIPTASTAVRWLFGSASMA